VVDVDGVVMALHHFQPGEEHRVEDGGRYLADAASVDILQLARSDDAGSGQESPGGGARADLLVDVEDVTGAMITLLQYCVATRTFCRLFEVPQYSEL